ncbi:DUF362 domain-containing protein [Tissierella sp. Yu-01]|uniref:DUF362 domain-containing protein n=1 Tax=Tissierella sp. Yu-01 TaxID=3035694 RepID=UPI00240D791A|nr:DUF362 domain-containing protein [Tissierella sp. Yu-01]WFA09954.1 DUF362 domain-containing protein [Tissierella sp. Yu-01]
MSKIGIVKCESYDYDKVIKGVFKALDGLDNIKNLKTGRVLVKTNLLKKNKPEDGVTTHPYIVEGVVRYFQERGHKVIVGDSPGGPFLPGLLKSYYETSGLTKVANTTNCELNFDTDSMDVHNDEAIFLKNMKVVKVFNEVDYVVSCGKLKTHTMMTYTGAVKNLFGVIPGVIKADYHLKMNNIIHFANALIDICEYMKPVISILDGIEAMEGDGPSSGEIRNLGLILAGDNPYDLDYVAAKITRIQNVPTIIESAKRGLLSPKEELVYYGDDISDMEILPFKLPKSTHVNFISGRIPKFVEDFILDNMRPFPTIKDDMCISCAICAKNCPAKIISMESGKPVINTEECIRCFCCHELCPKGAVGIKRHPLHKMIFKG